MQISNRNGREEMEVFKAILKRRSIRKFKDKPITEESVKKLLEAGRWAPTGGNRQPWYFVETREQKKISSIKMFAAGLGGTPTLIIAICADDTRNITLMDISMAAENIMLEAVELGLGTCAVASFNKDPVRLLFGIPEDKELILLITIGHPEGEPKLRPKKPLEEIAFSEKFGGKLNL
jgi:nitroreductase